jgi:pectinesterase
MPNMKYYIAVLISFVSILSFLQANTAPYPTYWVVAPDGSGDFERIQDAINQCKSFPDERITIFIKKGTYNEKITVHSWNTKITLLGEDKENTIITHDSSAGKVKNGTFWTYTLLVQANDTRIENLTVQNTAGEVGQAVALHVESDRVVVKNCNILGHQDTLYAAGENSRQLYDSCYIDGTTDYIFGAATAVFRNCTLHTKKNSYITAASTPKRIRYGYVFFNCQLTYAEGVTKVYLGRPWRQYAKTVFIECGLGDHIVPEGWKAWSNADSLATTFYAEYACTGPSADRTGREEWSHGLTDEEAKNYTLENIFSQTCEAIDEELNWYKQ